MSLGREGEQNRPQLRNTGFAVRETEQIYSAPGKCYASVCIFLLLVFLMF